jgi:glycosyltransferase involved in cell wall biosynthesis
MARTIAATVPVPADKGRQSPLERLARVSPHVAVVVPCRNEQATVAKVVADFRAALPGAEIYVYDNASDDRTSQLAAEAGATVRHEPRRGKGNAVRRAFADIDADIYVLVDGDDTYDAGAAADMVAALSAESLDFVNGARRHQSAAAYRPGHAFGNRMLTGAVARLFHSDVRDMLSGYKVLSRRFVKSFPMVSSGFELETELMVHALELGMPMRETETAYRERPANSTSKLRTFRDGARILLTIFKLVETERPLAFFSGVAAVLTLLSLGLGLPVVVEFFATGLVERFPTAMLSGFLGVLAVFSLFAGLILDQTRRMRHELKRLFYLGLTPRP